MKKTFVIILILIGVFTGSYYYLGGFNKWEFETIDNPSPIRLIGEEYQGLYDSKELKALYFKYRDFDGVSPLIIINYNLDYDNKTGVIHAFVGIQNGNARSVPKSELREISPSKLIRVELKAHNTVIPSPELVLGKARKYATMNNLVLGNYTIERYRNEWLTIIEFPVISKINQ